MPSKPELSLFELPPELVEPALQMCRLFNTGLDEVFYDVPTLRRDLRERGLEIGTTAQSDTPDATGRLNLGAMKNPEGSLLVIDAARKPYVRAFHDVETFLACPEPEVTGIEVATIAGVGSSALGSAALAWNVSKALNLPVLGIVPGYGVADALMQGLGGWFGFGLHNALQTKSYIQEALAGAAPRTASLGRGLSASLPNSKTLPNGGPVFRTGSGSSDVLHALMNERPFRCLVGHSKGALAIANALYSLETSVDGLDVVTLGCPVAENVPGARYHQFLGLYDALGQLNAWGNRPNSWVATDHSTNVLYPLSMDAQRLVPR